ncbi:ABC transporter permease [Muricauda sp. CAU 1633]|uniref:ABC transporter permease n=1 Tax=Allomuricauda sp. CAU 1633 TaxID=2816036 RepID=UPI001A8ED998|nr:ABC transporter permease [Muricauda sp. CAU 1633]MBO0321074.1 ABC transporter permease [Muricauda sp. CAU 1633]
MFKNYIRIAWRNLLKRKVFTTINILGLAIGFGSSILLYMFLTYHLSFDNFHENSDRIYRVVTEEQRDYIDYEASVPPAFAKVFREDYNYAEKVAKVVSWENYQLNIGEGTNSKSFKEDAAFVEPDFFGIMTFPILEALGTRSLLEPNTAYISERMAQKMYGAENPLGKTFLYDNKETIEVIGILKNAPKTSLIPEEIFISYPTLKKFNDFTAEETWGGISSHLQCFALLHPNQNIAQIENVLTELPKKHRPNSKNKHVYKLQPLSDIHFNPKYGGIDPALMWIFGVIGLFLIAVACINFINISTAQAFYRSKEIGVRKVLGSFKQHLFWQFLSETFVISLFAIGLGVLFAVLFLPSFNNLFELELSMNSLLNVQFFAFLISVLLLVSFLSGSYPGILMSRIVPVLALKGKLSHNDTGGTTTRKVLVVAQFAISITLIAATLIISRQIDYAVNSDLGFDKESIVMVGIPKELEKVQLNSLKEQFAQIPEVTKVSACLTSPGGAVNNWGTSVKYHNRPEFEEFSIQAKLADANYLNTFDIPLVAGRNFFENSSDSIAEVVVNEKLGEKLGIATSEELLGKQITANGGYIKATIVGVVKNFHDNDFTEEISPIFIANQTRWFDEIAIKTNGQNMRHVVEQIGQPWVNVFPGYIYEPRFLDDRVAEQYETEQRYLSLSKVFSALAILIGCLGLYGLILFFVGQRTKEIGIRKVLGSNIANILALFTVDFFRLILIAGVLATPIAWYLMEQWLQGYTYRTQIHWWVFAIAIVAIMIITLITISYQTLKVAMANPVKSLRTE